MILLTNRDTYIGIFVSLYLERINSSFILFLCNTTVISILSIWITLQSIVIEMPTII